MRTVKPSELPALIGSVIGISGWFALDQTRINDFAEITEDRQFIHIDPERAKDTPFGGTIAHGFLTLSMLSAMIETGGIALEGAVMGINYGFDKVRFLAPVRSGKRVRAHFTLSHVTEKKPGHYLLSMNIRVEIEGEENPALIADWLGMQILG